MLENLDRYKIILASNSPRRKELLSGLDIKYEIRLIPDIDETYPSDINGAEIPRYLSKKKALAYTSTMADDEIIITADTIVYSDGKVLGKPETESEAFSMLQQLSGKTHEVITGVTIMTLNKCVTFDVTSEVTFDLLTESDINYYISKYKPLDKAGAYGIQEWIGYIGVTSLNGSYYNVMGLPVQRLYKELKAF